MCNDYALIVITVCAMIMLSELLYCTSMCNDYALIVITVCAMMILS